MTYVVALIHEEDGNFGISFPDFPGCISTGEGLDSVLQSGGQALAFHLEGMVEDGAAIPALRTPGQIRNDASLTEELQNAAFAVVPVELPGKSVRVNITMDEHLLAAIDRAASSSGASRSGFLAEAARARIGGG
jgi:predicted RNase H-like HicB family nuclease